MPSLPQQVIPAAGYLQITIRVDKGLAVLKITNEAVNIMRYVESPANYGDIIPANMGSIALHTVDGDKPPNTFRIYGTAADTFAVYYEGK